MRIGRWQVVPTAKVRMRFRSVFASPLGLDLPHAESNRRLELYGLVGVLRLLMQLCAHHICSNDVITTACYPLHTVNHTPWTRLQAGSFARTALFGVMTSCLLLTRIHKQRRR